MTAIGETLRRERLKRNLDLEQISRELKISPRLLDAIEQEKFDRLPGEVFAKSFVRQYARYLGLDEEELAGELQRQFAPPPPVAQPEKTAEAVPEMRMAPMGKWESIGDTGRPSSRSPLMALALVVLVMLGCAGVYALWQRARLSSFSAAEQGAARTGQAAVTRPQPAPTEAQPAQAQQAQNAAAQPATGPPAAEATPSTPTPATSGPATPSETAGAASNPNAAVRVQLTAQEPVWVRAQSDGKYLFSGTLQPNETRTVEAGTEIRLRLGNAAGVTILLNGKPVGQVGPKGQVRTVQFTSGGFNIVSAPKPAPPEDF
jgi:cytoskeleton protein RodZ